MCKGTVLMPSIPSLLDSLTRSRPLPEHQAEDAGLKRTLSAKDLIVFGVSAMIGTGIFVLTGQGAADNAGPALVISFLISGLICVFCALSYSELSTLIPISGSAYSYMFIALGEFVAWIVGWLLVVEYLAGNMCIAQGWGKTILYGVKIFGESLANLFHNPALAVGVPTWLNTSTFTVLEKGQSIPSHEASVAVNQVPFTLPGSPDVLTLVINQSFDIFPVVGLLFCAWLLTKGVEENAKLATAMVYIKIGIILFFLAIGGWFLFSHPDLFGKHWFAEGWKTFAPFGNAGIIKGAALMFFAYVGFDALACSAEEAKDPQKDMPIGILGSLLICTILYVLVTVVVTAVNPIENIHRTAAVAQTMTMMNVPGADLLVVIGEVIGISSVMLIMQMATIRVVYSIARDRLLPAFLKKMDPRLGVPLAATWIVAGIGALGAALLPISLVSHIASLGTLFVFLMVCVGVVILRFTMPEAKRPFRVPFGITIPLLGVAGCLWLMMSLSSSAWFLTLVALAIGLAIYFTYGMHNSIMKDPESLESLDIEVPPLAMVGH
jgi:APA family basic amino acid/polyamine antiporter